MPSPRSMPPLKNKRDSNIPMRNWLRKEPRGPAAPAPSGMRYSPPGPAYQGGEAQGGGAGPGETYQYGAPTPESGYPSGQSPAERRLIEEQFRQEKKSGIGEFKQQVAVSRAAGKPYGMILLGAGLTALAALFGCSGSAFSSWWDGSSFTAGISGASSLIWFEGSVRSARSC